MSRHASGGPADPRRRLAWAAFSGVALGSSGLFAAFIAAPLVATDIGISRSWAGVPGAASILGTALGASWLSRVMAARGRRAGLELGWAIGVMGAVAATAAVSGSLFIGLVVAMFIMGIGHSANQLARFAAADMYPEAARPSVIGLMVWAGTIGAVLGPILLQVGETVARNVDISSRTGGFLVACVFFVAALVSGQLLRPDPSEMAEDDTLAMVTDAHKDPSIDGMLKLPHVRLAVTFMVVGQVAMTLIMTMSPVHIREHGHGLDTVGVVMSSHFMGMFAFAPLIGKLVARIGSYAAGLTGMALIVVAALGTATAPGESGPLLAACLFLLGMGWCFGFVAGSALLTRGLAYARRVRLQGRVDSLVWTSSAIGSLASGALLGTFGYTVLSLAGAVAVLVPMSFVVARRSSAEPAPSTTV